MRATLGPEGTARRSHLAFRILVLLALVGLVAGIPLILVETHATPPNRRYAIWWFTRRRCEHALEAHVSDGAALKLLWLVSWLTWGWFAVCVVLEIVGWVRGRSPRRLPGSQHIQWLAKCLIGATLAFGVDSLIDNCRLLRLQVVSASSGCSGMFDMRRSDQLPTPDLGGGRYTVASSVAMNLIGAIS